MRDSLTHTFLLRCPTAGSIAALNRFLDMYASGGYVRRRPWPPDRAGVRDGRAVPRAVRALFHGETLLQDTAHALVPWVITWDDHEIANDHVGDVSKQDDDVEAFRTRRAAACPSRRP
jgi:hypothetical protein